MSDYCLKNPFDVKCSNYVPPSELVTSNTTFLCSQMKFMPGCTVNTVCENYPEVKSNNFCQPFSIYSDICEYDMPKMKGCMVRKEAFI